MEYSHVYFEQSPPWFYGVISMLKGSKSQKNVENRDFSIFPIAACANFQEGSEKDSCPMWNDGEFFPTLYIVYGNFVQNFSFTIFFSHK